MRRAGAPRRHTRPEGQPVRVRRPTHRARRASAPDPAAALPPPSVRGRAGPRTWETRRGRGGDGGATPRLPDGRSRGHQRRGDAGRGGRDEGAEAAARGSGRRGAAAGEPGAAREGGSDGATGREGEPPPRVRGGRGHAGTRRRGGPRWRSRRRRGRPGAGHASASGIPGLGTTAAGDGRGGKAAVSPPAQREGGDALAREGKAAEFLACVVGQWNARRAEYEAGTGLS